MDELFLKDPCLGTRRLVEIFRRDYGEKVNCKMLQRLRRLHSAIGYIAPADRLANRHCSIFQQRDLKLEAARKIRKHQRQQLAAAVA